MPISWFGYGDGSTKATSETQQDPATIDYKAMREGFMQAIEDLLYFVIDQAILSGAVASSAIDRTVEVTDEDGQTLRRRIRECVTISASVIPVAPEQRAQTPLVATKTALEIISTDDARTAGGSDALFTPEQMQQLLNYALAYDGTGIEMAYREQQGA